MANITGQAGVNLTSELAAYLDANQGNLTIITNHKSVFDWW